MFFQYTAVLTLNGKPYYTDTIHWWRVKSRNILIGEDEGQQMLALVKMKDTQY